MEMFNRLNQQQQPFIRSGYNAMGRLNTLLGLGGGQPRPMGGGPMAPGPTNQMYSPKPNGGIRQIAAVGSAPKGNHSLAQLLMLRAQNGDTEAQRVLSGMQ